MCSHLFAGRISDEQKSLSDGGEKDIGKYRPALTTVFEQLSEAELQQCEDVAVEWNTNGLPDEVQRKWVTFTLYSDQLVTSTQNVKEQVLRYETEGLNFFATKKEYGKGPNNIIDLWKQFHIGNVLFQCKLLC